MQRTLHLKAVTVSDLKIHLNIQCISKLLLETPSVRDATFFFVWVLKKKAFVFVFNCLMVMGKMYVHFINLMYWILESRKNLLSEVLCSLLVVQIPEKM